MNSQPTKRLLDHWLSIGGADGVPERLALEPSALASVLGWTLMLEVPSMRIRVRGSQLEPWLSATWREYLDDACDPLDAAEITRIAEDLSAGRRVRRVLRFSSGASATLMLLPLTLGLGQISRAIGAVDHTGPVPGGLARIVRAGHLRLVHSATVSPGFATASTGGAR